MRIWGVIFHYKLTFWFGEHVVLRVFCNLVVHCLIRRIGAELVNRNVCLSLRTTEMRYFSLVNYKLSIPFIRFGMFGNFVMNVTSYFLGQTVKVSVYAWWSNRKESLFGSVSFFFYSNPYCLIRIFYWPPSLIIYWWFKRRRLKLFCLYKDEFPFIILYTCNRYGINVSPKT